MEHKIKKPFNYDVIFNNFKKNDYLLKSHEIAIIGDRLMTDIILGNLNNCFSIYTQPLEKTHENNKIKTARSLETLYLTIFKKRRIHSKYENIYFEKLINDFI